MSKKSVSTNDKMQDTCKVKAVVPIERNVTLTKYEAAEYNTIGVNRIETALRGPSYPFVLYGGSNKKLVKHKEFDEFIHASFAI